MHRVNAPPSDQVPCGRVIVVSGNRAEAVPRQLGDLLKEILAGRAEPLDVVTCIQNQIGLYLVLEETDQAADFLHAPVGERDDPERKTGMRKIDELPEKSQAVL